MYQIFSKILSNPADRTRVTLIFCNKTEEDILMKPILDDLAKKHPDRFKVIYMVDKPSTSWKGGSGYISKDVLKQHIAPPSADTLVIVCGPPPFYNLLSGPKTPDYQQGELKGLLKELGYNEGNVFKM